MARVAFRAGLTSAHRSQPCSVRGCPAATSLATRAWWHEGKREADRRAGAFADVNKQQADGLTPLMDAALAGDVDLVRALIARGAAVEPPKPEGMPRHWQLRRDGPLRAAVHARSPEAVREILAAGADPNACGDDGSTPIPAATLLLAPLEAEACNRLRSVFVGERETCSMTRCILGEGYDIKDAMGRSIARLLAHPRCRALPQPGLRGLARRVDGSRQRHCQTGR